MRRAGRSLLVVLALVAAAGCLAPGPPYQTQKAWTDSLAFEEMQRFLRVREKRGYHYEGEFSYMNWSWDCSPAGSAGYSSYYDFRNACKQHDFGYRNYGRLEQTFGRNVWNEAQRHLVDDQMRVNMYNDCSGRWFFQRGACQREADIWYFLVRWLGHS